MAALPPNISLHKVNLEMTQPWTKKRKSGRLCVQYPFEELLLVFQKSINNFYFYKYCHPLHLYPILLIPQTDTPLFYSRVLTSSLSFYNLVQALGGQSIKDSQERDLVGGERERERDTVVGSKEVENGSPSHCFGFPAELFLVHIGLSYKGSEAEVHADKC